MKQAFQRLYARLPIPAQNLACTVAGWRRARARFTPEFHRALAELERSVDDPVEVHRERQWRALRALLLRAREVVPACRDLPPPADHPDPEEALRRTLERIPPLDKATYRDRPKSFIARDIPKGQLLRGHTSGTTGTALPLWHTPRALAHEYAVVWRMYRRFGARLGDPSLRFGGQIVVPFGQRKPPFWRVSYRPRQTLFSIYHLTPENLHAYVAAIHAAPARFVQGYPSSLHLVAQAMLDAGRPLPVRRLCAVFTSSERLLASHRETIEKAFQAPVVDRYGSSEFCVSLSGCEAQNLHVDMEFCIVEVERFAETDGWVRGPLLVTGLRNDATPFLRYRIGDVGTLSKKPCPCGRPGDVLLDVDGRLEDYVVTPDGRRIGRVDHIFKEQYDIAEAQILQDTEKAIEVLVVPRLGYGEASERSLLREIRSRLGSEIEVTIRKVDAIPREASGKFRAVKSRVGSRVS